MFSKALCTFGVGGYSACLEIARPTFQSYADKHGYGYVEGPPNGSAFYKRPPSWGKVLLLMELLQMYSAVLWFDCDVLITDESEDLADMVPEDKIQALVAHTHFKNVDMGENPSCGMWYVRTPMIPYLQQQWAMTKYLNHSTWEQAAMQEMLGYSSNGRYTKRVRDTQLYRDTHFLPEEWHSIQFYDVNAPARTVHFPAMPVVDRVEWMRDWTKERLHGNRQ